MTPGSGRTWSSKQERIPISYLIPQISPLLYVHDGRIVLCHVGLSHSANLLLPGNGRLVDGGQTLRKRDDFHVASICIHSGAVFGRRSRHSIKAIQRGGQRNDSGSGKAGLQKVAAVQHGLSQRVSTKVYSLSGSTPQF